MQGHVGHRWTPVMYLCPSCACLRRVTAPAPQASRPFMGWMEGLHVPFALRHVVTMSPYRCQAATTCMHPCNPCAMWHTM
jgi:hypothetical protein